MNYSKFILALFVVGLVFTSCNKDEVDNSSEMDEKMIETQEQALSKKHIQKISSLYLNPVDAQYTDFLLPDGSTKRSILIEGDIAMSEEQLENMEAFNIDSRQYRTYNLVSSPRTINVIGYTGGGGQGLTNKQKNALQDAIDNYNDLNIGLSFTLTFGTYYSPYDIVVYQNPNGQAGAVAGFPENGDPYKYVQIYSGMSNYSTATNEHVMTHEIGHCLGMRHTDWDTRLSCGGSGEAADPYGAVHIPGTPTGYDANSVMLACFSANEDGNFGYYDTVAFDYLY